MLRITTSYANGCADLILDSRQISAGALELEYLATIADFIDGGCFFDREIARMAYYRHNALTPSSRDYHSVRIDERIVVLCNAWLAEHPATSAKVGA